MLGGEVSAAEIDARRGAGTAAYSLLDEASAAVGDDNGTRLFKLCAWNAFALQTIVDTLIAADAAGDPTTAGYVPRSTLAFARSCVDSVPEWIRQARIVQSDPAARVGADLPAKLPRWLHDEPTKQIELRGLRAAYEALEARVASDLAAFAAAAPAERADEVAHLRHVHAEMLSSAEYAQGLSLGSASAGDRGEVRWRLLDALGHAFELGQLLAVPTLTEVVHVREDRAADLPLSTGASWLQIGPAWPVLDRSGVIVGHVERVRGNRQTGEFEGLDVDAGPLSAAVGIAPEAIATIGAGQITLRVDAAELART